MAQEAGSRIQNLVALRISQREVEDMMSADERTDFYLLDATEGYREWTAVSHTFTLLDDGGALLTILYERITNSG